MKGRAVGCGSAPLISSPRTAGRGSAWIDMCGRGGAEDVGMAIQCSEFRPIYLSFMPLFPWLKVITLSGSRPQRSYFRWWP
jgi:hypothetical protein